MSASYLTQESSVVVNNKATPALILNCPTGVVLSGAAAGALDSAAGQIALGDANLRTAGGAAGTFVLQKDVLGAGNVVRYLPVNVGGVDYWIPLMPTDPETT